MTDGKTSDGGLVPVGTTKETIEVKRRTISPYDLTSSDNPGSIISQPLLRGSNYDEWATNLRLALVARKKFGFVDGTIPQPKQDSTDLEDWWTNNALVVSWMKLTIDANVRTNLSHHDVARSLWEHIQKRFSVKNGSKIQRIKTEIATAQQRGQPIEAHFGYLNKLWTTLTDYRPMKRCKCGSCTCDLNLALEQERDEDRVHEFVRGLDDVYIPTRSALLSRVPFPTLDDVYNTLTQEEDSRMVVRSYTEQTGGVSFAVQSQPRNRGSPEDRDKSSTCTSCGRTGHSADTCFRQIGYPPWWGDRPRNKGPVNRGSAQASMKNRGKETALVNAMGALGVGSQGTSSSAITEADRVGFSGLNETQWRTLVSMLEERKQPPPTRLSGKNFFETWILDSGATNHMTGSKDYITDIQYMAPINIKLPDGRFTVANQKGLVSMGTHIELKDVFLVDGLDCHLISVSQLTRDSYCIFQISDKLCTIQDRIKKTLIGAGEQLNGLYFFRSVSVAAALMTGCTERLSRDVWHRRLGHPSSKVVDKLNVSGFSNSGVLDNKACEVCIRAKHSRDLFPNSLNKTSAPFELIHCDLWGPYRTPALCGARYFLTILDDYSRSLWLYLLPNKQQAPTHIRQFFSLVERQFDTRIKTFRSDNGSEFICLTDFFRDKGVIHETSCVGTPQQNGRVERKHRHILNVARALRFQGSLPIEFWGECALAAGYLINRTPSDILKGKTPFEMLYKRPPPIQHLRTMGCLCYVHEQKHGGDKFASRSKRSIFLGYPFGKKGWRVFDLETRKVSVSRDVIFFEDEFPFSTLPVTMEEDNELMISTPVIPIPAEEVEMDQPTTVMPTPPVTEEVTTPSLIVTDTEEDIETVQHDLDGVAVEHDEEVNDDDNGGSELNQSEVVTAPVEEELLGRGHRQKTKSIRLKDFVANTIHMTSCYPIEDFVSCDRFSDNHRIYLAAVADNVIPQHYSQAVLDPNFRGAMKHEIIALEDSGTWTVEDLPPGKKVLGCRWVYCIKYRADGTIERHKARLVVFGNHQVEGEDYTETFAPVAKMTTIRCFLELVAARDWEVHQMDVHNAFFAW